MEASWTFAWQLRRIGVIRRTTNVLIVNYTRARRSRTYKISSTWSHLCHTKDMRNRSLSSNDVRRPINVCVITVRFTKHVSRGYLDSPRQDARKIRPQAKRKHKRESVPRINEATTLLSNWSSPHCLITILSLGPPLADGL